MAPDETIFCLHNGSGGKSEFAPKLSDKNVILAKTGLRSAENCGSRLRKYDRVTLRDNKNHFP